MARTVLVVDDEESVRRRIVRILAGEGFKVLSAAGAADALTICRRHPVAIDLLVAEVVMRETSGPELAAELMAMRPGIKVLFVSRIGRDHSVWRKTLASAPGFVQKPFRSETLRLKVREVLGPRRRAGR